MLGCEDWNNEEGSFAAGFFEDIFLDDDVFLMDEPESPFESVDQKADEDVEGNFNLDFLSSGILKRECSLC